MMRGVGICQKMNVVILIGKHIASVLKVQEESLNL